MDRFGFNLGYVDDLFASYLRDPASVSEVWRDFFADYHPGSEVTPETPAARSAEAPEASPVATPASTPEAPPTTVVAAETEVEEEEDQPQYQPLRGVAGKIVSNMETSLGVPTATSVRTLPVKLLEENRRFINQHQEATARPKVSFTHIIAWAIVRALDEQPGLNCGYELKDDVPHRVQPTGVHLGLAIDVQKKDGSRSLLVPNIKNANRLNFATFLDAYGDLVDRARKNRLGIPDFQGTTITLTNPGMIGTVLSVPRLMAGQGTIVGIGSIGYPPHYAGMAPKAVAQMGVSKVMTMTSTYDHRIIQGAESGAFLGVVERLLLGGDRFYHQLFDDLGVTQEPVTWLADTAPPTPGGSSDLEAISKQAHVLQLIHAFRVRGHLVANLDPLGQRPQPHPELEMSNYGLCVWDLDREFVCGGLAGRDGTMTLRQILDVLRETYCRYIGVEYMHIAQPDERAWLQRRMETTRNNEPMELEEKLRILEKLNAAEAFERFLHNTYLGHKRFSLEGCESLIPVMDALLSSAADHGIHDAVIGMAHRGRLNVLANIVGKEAARIFAEFEDIDPDTAHGSGDVKYHLGASGTHESPSGKEIALTIASNPSHLESVDPVVEGMARARQDRNGDENHEWTLPILIHGDAAFAGQGVVFETLNFSQLKGYRTGGTVHIVTNNQIGFTTGKADARSTYYCTDVAKAVGAPIFHVNGDHPQAAVRAIRLAMEYRQEFHKDVVVDLNCYRKWGHNEGDEPAYTQPLMYELIDRHRSVRKLCTERLLRRNEIDGATAERMLEDFRAKLEHGFETLEEARQSSGDVQPLPDLENIEGAARPPVPTAVERDRLDTVLEGLLHTPEDFEPHAKLQKQLSARRKMYDEGRIPWALAESLAFGSLVLEGVRVRLSGQDSGRGTFSQRHAKIYDHRTGKSYAPLANLAPDQGRFQVFDSLLSEFAVMGFEYGYSVENPTALVMWEAQFGDFANGAQVIQDQYISSAEEKWGQTCRLVLLLPHGYEGQGPEHSSARLERYLQLCSEGNQRVAYPSTPAQYFHLLRRQIHTEESKPLIVMTPKSLLRHRECTSSVEQLANGNFEVVLDDPNVSDPSACTRIVLCSGKVYYDLAARRRDLEANHVALVRLEQFYPFPGETLERVLGAYSNAREILWVQEEPRNMGAWDFLDERLVPLLSSTQTLYYVGRTWSASTATGSHNRHLAEQRKFLDEALRGDLDQEPAAHQPRDLREQGVRS